MKPVSIKIGGREFVIDAEKPLDISIPLRFGGVQPNAYGVERASSAACAAGALIGDTRHGGSVNFEQYKLIPHCNGTHTECAGHITHARISVVDCLQDVFIPAVLVSIEPETAAESNETYAVEPNETDKLITRQALEDILGDAAAESFDGLIIRTRPNDEDKLSRVYADEIPPFFSTEAMQLIAAHGIKHLLVDLPSIDRIYDEGKLSNHRIFWNIRPGAFETDAASRLDRTITELIFVPDEVTDGSYLLNLQIALFASDASPSRPILFKI